MAETIYANPLGAIAQATEIVGARERLSALREQRQYGAQDRLMALQDRQSGMDEKQRKIIMQAFEFAGNSAPEILSAPTPEEKNARYQQFRSMSGLMGFPVAMLPQEYSPEVERRLNMARMHVLNAQQGRDRTQFGTQAQFFRDPSTGQTIAAQGSTTGGFYANGKPIDVSKMEPVAAPNTIYSQEQQNARFYAKPDIAAATRQAEAGVDLATKPAITAAETTAKKTAEAAADRNASVIKAISDEKEVGRILDMAEPLLEKATASLAGAGVDAAGRLIGVSNEGSRAAAQLKTLEGALIMKMPRMEGPQSNLDQQLYRQMAAQIGDPTIPADMRKAAMDTLRELNKRYTGSAATANPKNNAPAAPASQPGTFKSSSGIQFTVE